MDKLSTNLPPNENTFGDITQWSGETTLGVMYEKIGSKYTTSSQKATLKQL